MGALARIGVLVKVSAVQFREAEGVSREMCRRPIEKDADARVVAAVDKLHKLRGGAIAAGRGEIADRLITPRAVEGMLHDGEQLDVRVAQIFNIGNELVAKLVVGEPAIAVL